MLAKRVMAVLRIRPPKIGTRRRSRSRVARPTGVATHLRYTKAPTMTPTIRNGKAWRKMLEIVIRNWVALGSLPPSWPYIFLKIGTMNTSIAVRMHSTSDSTMMGYDRAERILPRSSTCFSIVVARSSRVTSRLPPVSPARTMAT